MWDYFRHQEFIIEKIWFYSRGSRYTGNGVLTWEPGERFHITASVTRKEALPEKTELHSIDVNFRPGFIRMTLEGGLSAFVRVHDTEKLDPFFPRHFSINVGRVTFVQELREEITHIKWYGEVLFETATNAILPDKVTSETLIEGERISQGFSRSGISFHGDAGYKIIGQLTDKKYLRLHWSLPKIHWNRTQCRQYSECLKYALSVSLGEEISLLYYEYYLGKRQYTDVRVRLEPTSLNLVLRTFDNEILNKEILVTLAGFFSQKSKESDICLHIFKQMVEASKQQTIASRELLLSTILEAALRTLYNHPFVPGITKSKIKFKVDQSLKRFVNEYFSYDPDSFKKWKITANNAIKIHRRLRHRNAHPDWLTSQGGMLSEENLSEAINDTIFLSRFYGYMILALAGVKNLEPKFPVDFRNWEPIMTRSRM